MESLITDGKKMTSSPVAGEIKEDVYRSMDDAQFVSTNNSSESKFPEDENNPTS